MLEAILLFKSLRQLAPVVVVAHHTGNLIAVGSKCNGTAEGIDIKQKTNCSIGCEKADSPIKEWRVSPFSNNAKRNDDANGSPRPVAICVTREKVELNTSRRNSDYKPDRRVHPVPLALRVVCRYSAHRAVCPAQGIGTPVYVGAARAPRPCGRGFLWSGVLRAPSGAPLPTTVVPIVARPATSFGTLGRTILVGDRP